VRHEKTTGRDLQRSAWGASTLVGADGGMPSAPTRPAARSQVQQWFGVDERPTQVSKASDIPTVRPRLEPGPIPRESDAGKMLWTLAALSPNQRGMGSLRSQGRWRFLCEDMNRPPCV